MRLIYNISHAHGVQVELRAQFPEFLLSIALPDFSVPHLTENCYKPYKIEDIRFMNIQNNDEDFSNKDIRGKDFSKKEDYKNKKFRYSKAGIKSIYRYSLIILFCLLSILISVALAISLQPLISGFQGHWIPIVIASSKNVDFTKANLTMTCFSNAKNIEYACLDKNHFLQNLKVQQLAIKLDVNKLSDKNFNYLDLEGINLENAKLQGASFIGANLKNANLKNADLSGANLKQAQLVGADLTGATLTGACIEDWGITKGTVLEEVKCESIFLECREEYDKNGHFLIKWEDI